MNTKDLKKKKMKRNIKNLNRLLEKGKIKYGNER